MTTSTPPDQPPPTRPDLSQAPAHSGAPAGHVKVLRVTPDGAAELVEVAAHRDAIVDAVEGRNPYDVTARVTWPMPPVGAVTAWTVDAGTAGPARVDVNELATALALEFMPPHVDGACRNRARIEQEPLRGVVVFASYDPHAPGGIASLHDVAVGRMRASMDGTGATRARAAAENTPTVQLPAVPEEPHV